MSGTRSDKAINGSGPWRETMATPLPAHLRAPTTDRARLHWRAAGAGFAGLAGIGFLFVAIGRPIVLDGALAFDTAQNLLHAVLAALAVVVGFGDVAPALARRLAAILGVGYVLLAVAGLLSADLFGLGALVGLRLEWAECLLYLLLGAWAAYAGLARG